MQMISQRCMEQARLGSSSSRPSRLSFVESQACFSRWMNVVSWIQSFMSSMSFLYFYVFFACSTFALRLIGPACVSFVHSTKHLSTQYMISWHNCSRFRMLLLSYAQQRHVLLQKLAFVRPFYILNQIRFLNFALSKRRAEKNPRSVLAKKYIEV